MLYGFVDYYKKTKLSSSIADSEGRFTIPYPKLYPGATELHMGITNLVVLLDGEDITVSGTSVIDHTQIKFHKSTLNTKLLNYTKYLNFRNRVEPAWLFLQENYGINTLNIPAGAHL